MKVLFLHNTGKQKASTRYTLFTTVRGDRTMKIPLTILLTIFILYFACDHPVNPIEDSYRTDILLMGESHLVIENKPYTFDFYLRFANHIDSISVIFGNSISDTGLVYEKREQWMDTLSIDAVFDEYGTTKITFRAFLSDGKTLQKEFEIEVLSSPVVLLRDEETPEYIFASGTPTTLYFRFAPEWETPNAITQEIIDNDDVYDSDPEICESCTTVPDLSQEITYTFIACHEISKPGDSIPITLTTDIPGKYTLNLVSTWDDYTDTIQLPFIIFNPPCLQQKADSIKEISVNSRDTLLFKACEDGFSPVEIELLNRDEFGDKEIQLSSGTEFPRTLRILFTPSEVKEYRFSVLIKNEYDKDTVYSYRISQSNMYTVTFETDGGTEIESQVIGEGEYASLPDTIPVKTGYEFRGWYTTDNFNIRFDFEETPITRDRTIYAHWVRVYTIAYDKNRAQSGTVPLDSNLYETGSPVSIKSNSGELARPGYTFDGWNSREDGSGRDRAPEEIILMGTSDITLFAKWKMNPPKIVSQPSDTAIRYGSGTTFSVEVDGVELEYQWQRDGSNLEGATTSSLTITDITNDNRVYRCIVRNHAGRDTTSEITLSLIYSITYRGNGNTSGEAPEEANYYLAGTEVTISGNTGALERLGFEFDGWTRGGADDTVVYREGDILIVAGNETLNAWWVPKDNILAFDPGPGEGVMEPQEVPTDETITLPAYIFTRAGYEFAGWAERAGGEVVYDDEDEFTMGVSGVTLHAVWKALSFTLSFDPGDGEGEMESLTIATDSTFDLPASGFTRDLYEQNGWALEADGDRDYGNESEFRMFPHNTTLYAVWKPLKPQITTHPQGDTLLRGSGITFKVEALGAGLHYQWERDGSIIEGATGEEFILADITSEYDSSVFRCLVYNESDEIRSDKALLRVTHRVEYYGNGSDQGDVPSDNGTYLKGVEVEVKGTTEGFARTGYEFAGWSIGDDREGERYNEGDKIKMELGDLMLYAQWEAVEYAITYQLDGGTNHGSNPGTYTVESAVTLLQPEKVDYSFEGWYTDNQFGERINEIPKGATGPYTLYAKWDWDSTLTDIDGNVYTTVRIGNQIWTVENLRTTKYSDGTPIDHVTENAAWAVLSTSAYCWYQNDSDQGYGALYNWWVVAPDNEYSIAPDGWRVPTDEEWTELEEYLIANGYNWDETTSGNKIGKSMASKGGEWYTFLTQGRVGNDQTNNNRTGFSALPGGYRDLDGNFYTVGDYGNWWSTSGFDESSAYYRRLSFSSEALDSYDGNKRLGYSVRLVRDR